MADYLSAPINAIPPTGDTITSYDRAHFATYLQLLDAHAMRVDWKETARIVLSLDSAADAAAAQRVYDAHLARVRWMTQAGYRQLLK